MSAEQLSERHSERQSGSSDLVPAPSRSPLLHRTAQVLMVLGAVLCLAALFRSDDRSRFAFAYLWAFAFIWTVSLGALFFVGTHHLVHAVWSVVIRRVAEMLAAPMRLVALLFLPILLFCLLHDQFGLYSWLGHEHSGHEHLLEGKRAYLNLPFLVVRAVAFFGLWIAFAAHFVGNSLKQDSGERGVEATLRMRRTSAPFVVIFAFTATFAGIDWLMSLAPLWFSTMFGVYVFAGMALTALAVVTIATLGLSSAGRLGRDLVGEGHLYNLGTLLFAFVCFWAYIAFSQYMLIWYGNIPEESFYMVQRLEGDWLWISVALALVRFVIPFLALLSHGAKINPRRLVWVSGLLIAGQWLDLYWLIMPEVHHQGPLIGWQELGPPLLLSGVFLFFVSRFLERHLPLAVGDPLLRESQQYYI